MFNLCRCAASSIVNHPKSLSSLRLLPIAGYKSQYSIDKLYPNSTIDFSSNPAFKVGIVNLAGKFVDWAVTVGYFVAHYLH